MTEFVEAQALTDPDGISPRPGDEEVGDAYDDMHHALEAALTDNGDLSRRVRGLLSVVGRAAELTATEENAHLGHERYICAPGELARELLERAAEHASVVLSDEEPDDDGSVRLNGLSMLAGSLLTWRARWRQISPTSSATILAMNPRPGHEHVSGVAAALRVVREHKEAIRRCRGLPAQTPRWFSVSSWLSRTCLHGRFSALSPLQPKQRQPCFTPPPSPRWQRTSSREPDAS